MIIQTGMRTDIPAFYSEWFINRIKEGFVMVRNPYNPSQVTRYNLSPDVVDLIAFCSKNPSPMIPYMEYLKPYGQYWFVTITPYGKDIEPNVPDYQKVMEDFKNLSGIVGADSVGWRYDPIVVDANHSVDWHIARFEEMTRALDGYTETCVISFIDIYKKVEKTMFRKGNVPATHRPVGTETLRSDGYIWVKVEEPNKWRLKQRLLWEQHNGGRGFFRYSCSQRADDGLLRRRGQGTRRKRIPRPAARGHAPRRLRRRTRRHASRRSP